MTPNSNIGGQTGRRQKAAKGTIKIEADKGWLRLRFTYQGKRKALALGLPDSKANRIFAEQKACQIEKDIYAGHFDCFSSPVQARETINLLSIRFAHSSCFISEVFRIWG